MTQDFTPRDGPEKKAELEQAKPAGDGWRSRKAQVTLGSLVIPWATATVGWLVMDKMTAQEWLDLVRWLVPLVAAIYAASNVAEKRGQK